MSDYTCRAVLHGDKPSEAVALIDRLMDAAERWLCSVNAMVHEVKADPAWLRNDVSQESRESLERRYTWTRDWWDETVSEIHELADKLAPQLEALGGDSSDVLRIASQAETFCDCAMYDGEVESTLEKMRAIWEEGKIRLRRLMIQLELPVERVPGDAAPAAGTNTLPPLPLGLSFFDKEAEALWVQAHVPRLVRAIKRSPLVEGDGKLVRRVQPVGLDLVGSEATVGMLFVGPISSDVERCMTRQLKEVAKLISDLASVFRNRGGSLTRLEYLFNELLNTPISEHVSSDGDWLVSRRRAIDASLLEELLDAAKDFGQTAKSSPESTDRKCDHGPRVVLRDREEGPLVLGRAKRKLTKPQFNVVRTAIDAPDGGWTKDQLVAKSGHEDALGILRRLAENDPDWQQVIHLAGRTGGGYWVK